MYIHRSFPQVNMITNSKKVHQIDVIDSSLKTVDTSK